MSNRRMGGNMGGGNRGGPNRSFNNQPFQGNVNPWQGGIMNQGGGLLSQLSTNPQQLALALSTLLQPQVQTPPSLMSLNSNNSGMNRGRDFDRFNNRGGRDNRRHEPYNKNRGGQWRDNNRNRNQGGGNRNKNQKDDKKKENKQDEKKEVKSAKDTKNDADQSMDEEEKKRDWKDEKKTTEDDDEGTDSKTEDKDVSSKEGKFFKIPPAYLSCFICNKQMWDGESMEKHLKGRAHSEMIKAVEESIGITVNILRENMRLTEERNLIEMHRIQRTKKFNKFRGPEESCNMCDLSFRGKMSSHRRGEGHQRLKRYLHPKCNMCDKEFHARIEWVEHRLTPDHLRKHCAKLEESAEVGQRSSDGASVIISLDEQDSQEMDLDKLLLEPTQMESDNPITELDDNLENMQNRFPAYKSDRPLGSHSIKEFTGFLCELCNRSFTNQEDSQRHLTSQRHYYKFIQSIKEKFDLKEKREKEEREEQERKEKEEKAEAEENGDAEEAEEEADNEVDDSLNDSAMETADETLNNTQEDSTMEDLQTSQEEDQILEEEVAEIKEEIVEEIKQEKPSPKKAAPLAANKPGPASKKAAVTNKPGVAAINRPGAAAVNKPGPASSKVAANNASPGTRGRKARK